MKGRPASVLMLCGALSLVLATALAAEAGGHLPSGTPMAKAVTMALLILGISAWHLAHFRIWKLFVIVPPVVAGFADHVYGISRVDHGERWSMQASLYIGVIAASVVFIGAVWSGLSERGSAVP